MDPHKISKALDNKQNEIILSLSSKKIKELNLKIIKELYLPKKTTSEYMKKLEDYRYVDEINDLKYGSYIRWINITDPSNLRLTRGATICDIKISDNGTFITCKNSYGSTHFNIKMDNCLIFQKLTNEENVILSVVNYLDT
jgi:hypothetical protein